MSVPTSTVPGAPVAAPGTVPTDPDDALICPPEALIDPAALQTEIEAALAEAGPEALRPALVRVLGPAIKQGRARIAEAFAAKPFAADQVKRSYTHLTDGVIRTVFDALLRHAYPLPNPTSGERLAVCAVGGYGRGEMAPFSDVDLLFVTPHKITPWAESVIEAMLYVLWDLGLKLGHASRSLKDCLVQAEQDYTVRTAMLESRPIAGDAALAAETYDSLTEQLFKGTERDFIAAKLQEREERHLKHGGQRYLVEPNVKEGKGGLRDLQSLFWIVKYAYHVKNIPELVETGLLSAEELAIFERADRFLWATRCHLHLISGRANEVLSFDMQVEVAQRMGYVDIAGRRAVEQFMQDYFRHATRVGDLTRILLTKIEASHDRAEPLIQRFFRRRKRLRAGFRELHGRLAIADDAAFLADRLNLLRLFEEGLRTGLLIHPDAMRLVTANLHLIDEDFRNLPESRKLFLDLLLKHGNPERALRRMNELGVLSAYIPEFEPIRALMQFNMYHSYTVDEHTIQCISQLSKLERRTLIEELPVASSILERGLNRRVLYVALLVHDIGKGRPEDHSILGARIARKVATRLGLRPREVDTVEWLVRYHLLMSDMAQKRDIADPRTVMGLIKAVQTRERLDLLTVLTVCDIRGVGPNVWNNWKASLLRALYRQCRRALENGMEALNRENRGSEAKKALREALSDWSARDLRAETEYSSCATPVISSPLTADQRKKDNWGQEEMLCYIKNKVISRTQVHYKGRLSVCNARVKVAVWENLSCRLPEPFPTSVPLNNFCLTYSVQYVPPIVKRP